MFSVLHSEFTKKRNKDYVYRRMTLLLHSPSTYCNSAVLICNVAPFVDNQKIMSQKNVTLESPTWGKRRVNNPPQPSNDYSLPHPSGPNKTVLVTAITSFKVIQGHRYWYQSKAHMQLPISD